MSASKKIKSVKAVALSTVIPFTVNAIDLVELVAGDPQPETQHIMIAATSTATDATHVPLFPIPRSLAPEKVEPVKPEHQTVALIVDDTGLGKLPTRVAGKKEG